jgi:peptide-methionine (S)-S-oxide reductase
MNANQSATEATSPTEWTNPAQLTHEVAIFAGGCFWCVEAVFAQIKGVQSAVSGYTGGTMNNPDYEAVCGKTTGHAESVQITFDPSQVSYETLLKVFFTAHDPTTLNQQGGDVGPHYRSAIFYTSPSQLETAHRVIAEVNQSAVWRYPVVTEVTAASRFWPAEDYHQGYFERVGARNGYCTVVIEPKVVKFKKSFAHLLK